MARKERTFDGCWTCRSRKVKCDLTKPFCLRCAKSKRDCLGYGIRLRWSDPVTISSDKNMTCLKSDGSEPDNIQRRNLDLMEFPRSMLYETYAELNSVLEKVDDSAVLSGKAKLGPFRCFRFSEEREPIRTYTEASEKSEAPTISPMLPSAVPAKRRRVAKTSIFSKTNNSHVHYDLLNFAKLTILAIKGPNYKFNDQNMMHILYPKFFPNLDSDDAWFANAILVNSKLYSRRDNELTLYPLLHNLLEHFTSELFSVNRIGIKNNYFDVFVIPYIKQIVGQFICWDFAFWDVNDLQVLDELDDIQLLQSIKLCIIYLCLGLSAFKVSKRTSLHEENEDDEYKIDEYLKISIELRKLSIKLLNYHLDESDVIAERQKGDKAVEDYDTMLLLALILQIELDSMFGVFENLDLIYAIGDFVIKNKMETRTRNATMNKFLINVFKIKYFFYESTQAINLFNYQMEKEDELRYKDLNEDYNLIKDLDSEGDEDDNDNDNDDEPRLKPSIENMLSASAPAKKDYVPTAFTINFSNNRQYSAAYEVTGDSIESSISTIKFAPNLNIRFTTTLDTELIYLMYGIPKDLLHIFHESIHLANHKNIFSVKKVFPRNFPRLCAEVEDKLLRWNIRQSSWNLNPGNMFQNFLLNHIYSFHQAVIICHNILLKKNFDIHQQQDTVEKCLDYLCQAVDGARQLHLNYQPMFWNLLVAGSVATAASTQDRVKSIWQTCPGFETQSNYWRAKQILYEIWKRRATGEDEEDNLGFMNLIREWDIALSLG
ncbi:ARG83 [Candida margitis]|uniref:ARG83 n=1 Tax=Candida margitis TaxID=1775924 RepID=UPI0022265B4C|nr:ARG83 [Candida margitis]KAI5957406.1 ARG83 [Candida margitis]